MSDEPDEEHEEMTDESSDTAEPDASPGSADAEQDESNAFDVDGDVGPNRIENDERTGESADDSPEESGRNADAPLGSLAASVDERSGRETDRPDDGLFDQESVPEIDADVVWERLDDEPPELPDDDERDVRVIEKRSYCEQCPFFSAPPDVECGHDGTEILELVDMEHFRVVDCPKVREDERLERL